MHRELSEQPTIRRARSSPNDDIDPSFIERHSPRAFSQDRVHRDDLETIFEAARWAPSSHNEQPWRFVYATEPEDRERLLEALLQGNRAWAKNAPVLAFVLAKTAFAMNGKPNPHAWFDTGAAWMSLALQATKLGLVTHAMGGIDPDKARETLDVPDSFDVVCGLAIGHPPEEEADESIEPTDRLPWTEIAYEGTFGGKGR